MHKPVIAVSGSDQLAHWGAWNDWAMLVPSAYVRAVSSAGGVPVLVAPASGQLASSLREPGAGDGATDAEEDLQSQAAVIASHIDGLMLTGGVDLDPRRYGTEVHPATQAPDEARDVFEAALVEACCDRGLPVLAICRGLQVLNVLRGGSLYQHLPDTVGTDEHLREPGVFSRHWVRVDRDSQLAEILGRERLEVPTHHHQAVDRVGQGLRAAAWADDGIVEAVEDSSHGFVVAVQWHPEAGDDRSLFDALVKASAS
jgi:putative glutamine amidotransferase